MKYSKEIQQIRICRNVGDTLSKASKKLRSRGFTDTALLISEWREMIKLFGCRSVPLWYIEGWRKPGPITYSEAELRQFVSPPKLYGDGTYGGWLGITGPGKLFKAILAGEK